MSDENNLDLETFQVYPDEEPERKTAAPTEKKSKKVLGKTITQTPFSGGKKSNTKATKSTGDLMDKITPTIACVIGVAIVVVYIAVDLAGML